MEYNVNAGANESLERDRERLGLFSTTSFSVILGLFNSPPISVSRPLNSIVRQNLLLIRLSSREADANIRGIWEIRNHGMMYEHVEILHDILEAMWGILR